MPHEQLFSFSRRAMFGVAMTSCLLNNEVVLLHCFVRNNDEPVCDSVELLSVNLTYARIKYHNCRESSVYTSDLAPWPQMKQWRSISQNVFDTSASETELQITDNLTVDSRDNTLLDTSTSIDALNSSNADDTADCMPEPVVRRSTRTCQPPQRFGECINWFVTTVCCVSLSSVAFFFTWG